jgi:hypothetical protein
MRSYALTSLTPTSRHSKIASRACLRRPLPGLLLKQSRTYHPTSSVNTTVKQDRNIRTQSTTMETIKSTIAENMGGISHKLTSEKDQFSIENDVPDLSGKVGLVTGGSVRLPKSPSCSRGAELWSWMSWKGNTDVHYRRESATRHPLSFSRTTFQSSSSSPYPKKSRIALSSLSASNWERSTPIVLYGSNAIFPT